MLNTEAIAKAYVRRIERGVITVNDVPLSIREQVRALLNRKR